MTRNTFWTITIFASSFRSGIYMCNDCTHTTCTTRVHIPLQYWLCETQLHQSLIRYTPPHCCFLYFLSCLVYADLCRPPLTTFVQEAWPIYENVLCRFAKMCVINMIWYLHVSHSKNELVPSLVNASFLLSCTCSHHCYFVFLESPNRAC